MADEEQAVRILCAKICVVRWRSDIAGVRLFWRQLRFGGHELFSSFIFSAMRLADYRTDTYIDLRQSFDVREGGTLERHGSEWKGTEGKRRPAGAGREVPWQGEWLQSSRCRG